jgi:hypothetical protein
MLGGSFLGIIILIVLLDVTCSWFHETKAAKG